MCKFPPAKLLYRANIEGDQPLPMEVSGGNPGFYPEENEVKAGEGDDKVDVPAELTRSVVIGEKLALYLRVILFLREEHKIL